MIIRIRCSVGFVRIEIDQNKKIGDLKKIIEELLSVPVAEQELLVEGNSQKILKDDSASLKGSELENGSLVELKSKVKPVLVKQEKKETVQNESNKKQKTTSTEDSSSKKEECSNANGELNSKPIKQTSEEWNSKLNEKPDGNQPIFKSFDSFLKMRRYDTTDLPLNRSYKSIHITKGTMIRIPFSVTLKHQPYRHVDHLEFMNVKEVNNFVDYWCEENNMLIQRGGWMYGYYKEDSHYELGIRAVCECIYEPPQRDENGEVIFEEDPFLDTVNIIANRLGLERIGLIYTHLPRKEYITSSEIVSIAKLQLENLKTTHYTGYEVSSFVTCTISPDPMLQNEPLTNAYMISDLGMALLRDNVIAKEQKDPSHVALRDAEKNELLPQILEGGREAKTFDNDWLIVRVNESAPKVSRSIFKNNFFSRENRGTKQTAEDAKKYFNNPHLFKSGKSAAKYADFHLLLFIANVLGLETALAVCEAIDKNTEVDPVIEELIISFKS